jgi:hypothetical protein
MKENSLKMMKEKSPLLYNSKVRILENSPLYKTKSKILEPNLLMES